MIVLRVVLSLFMLATMEATAVRAVTQSVKAPRVWGVQGDRFTVDGTPAFLTFVSYFDALDANDAVLREDFAYFRAHGVDGVRIFPNWWDCADLNACKTPSPRTLMDPQGALRPGPLQRLRQVLATAAAHGLLVDVSFAREPVRDGDRRLSASGYEAGLLAITRALARGASGDGASGDGAPHVLFDLQNEVEINGLGDSRDVAAEVARLRAKVRAIDARRLAVVSTGSVDLIRQFAARQGDEALDAIAFHDPRASDWWSRTAGEVAALKAITARPIYFQEPIAYQLAHARPGRDDSTAAHFLRARDAARQAGAAAWLFHTRKGFRLDDRSFVAQQEPGDREFFSALAKTR